MPLIGKKANVLRPFWSTNDGQTVRLYLGHVTDVLYKLPAKSVHCCVTSPPYWGLRSYLDNGHSSKDLEIGSEPSPDCGTHGQAQCGGCFVCSMVAVFRGVRRVLRDEGTCWLNLGDTYGGGKCGGESVFANGRTDGRPGDGGISSPRDTRQYLGERNLQTNLKPGNLVGVPWRVALALQADGWVLRQDIVWAKPSPMPESCTNRCTKSHEYIFLLTKSARYYYDNEAIKDKARQTPQRRSIGATSRNRKIPNRLDDTGDKGSRREPDVDGDGNRNKRSVWTISSESYLGAHYATFPKKLITPCIKAGTSERGCCARCGSPWKRVVGRTALVRDRPNEYVKRNGAEGTGNSCANTVAGVDVKTLGWVAGCSCGLPEEANVPCTVLDPFIGSGTSAVVSVDLGRRCVGIDLSEDYLRDNAVVRIEGDLSGRPALRHLIGPPVKPVQGGRSLLR